MWPSLLLALGEGIFSKRRYRALFLKVFSFLFFALSLGFLTYGVYLYLSQTYGVFPTLGFLVLLLNAAGSVLWRRARRLEKQRFSFPPISEFKNGDALFSFRECARFFKEHRSTLLLGLIFISVLVWVKERKGS